MLNTRTSAMMLIIVLVSFMGFIVENIHISFSNHKIDNRNMLFPFLLGYGLAIIAIFTLFGTPNSPMFFKRTLDIEMGSASFIYYFVMAFLCVSIGELILGHFIEMTCNITWWDYSNIPLHVTKYTSIPTSTVFALLITIFMKYMFSPLLEVFSRINPRLLSVLSISLITILCIDFIHSGIYMFTHRKTLNIWEIKL